ncbi:MAG: hypothetical protein B7Z06_08290 [Flavobacteriales bacterium 32-35-8]|nr:MAG: hypothetical protein B7Z06_08290 [Flavobacteriales bacterium 32-35-8]
MKTIKQQIKKMIFFFALILSINVSAQKEIKHSLFIRVYNLEGRIINKGNIIFLNDSLIGLKNNRNIEINVRDIGFIKTKRSAGNNILIGAVAGGITSAVLGAVSSDPNDWVFSYTPAEGALLGGVLGALGGGAIGGITALSKKVKTYIINGDLEKWQVFKTMIEEQTLK